MHLLVFWLLVLQVLKSCLDQHHLQVNPQGSRGPTIHGLWVIQQISKMTLIFLVQHEPKIQQENSAVCGMFVRWNGPGAVRCRIWGQFLTTNWCHFFVRIGQKTTIAGAEVNFWPPKCHYFVGLNWQNYKLTSPEYINARMSLRSWDGKLLGISKTGCCHLGNGLSIDCKCDEQAEITTRWAEKVSSPADKVTSQKASSVLRVVRAVPKAVWWLLQCNWSISWSASSSLFSFSKLFMLCASFGLSRRFDGFVGDIVKISADVIFHFSLLFPTFPRIFDTFWLQIFVLF